MEELKEWLVTHLKNKDIIKKEIIDISEDKDHVFVQTSQQSKTYLAVKELGQSSLRFLHQDNSSGIVCLATKKNLNQLVLDWNAYISNTQLMVIFAEPGIGHYLVIKPYVHNMICDEKSLKQGLITLFDNTF